MKRFTDTDKWTKNKWFRLMPNEYKILWLFILDNCDMVGVWEEDIDFFNAHLGCKATIEDAKKLFGDRVKLINSDRKWWIIN
jgi:hypothetical protein